jgi:hypothetical protein
MISSAVDARPGGSAVLCTEPDPLCAGGGSWAEALFGGEKGQRPSAPLTPRLRR